MQGDALSPIRHGRPAVDVEDVDRGQLGTAGAPDDRDHRSGGHVLRRRRPRCPGEAAGSWSRRGRAPARAAARAARRRPARRRRPPPRARTPRPPRGAAPRRSRRRRPRRVPGGGTAHPPAGTPAASTRAAASRASTTPLASKKPAPSPASTPATRARLVGQLLGAAQEHVADLEHRNAGRPHRQIRAGGVQEPGEDERPHRRPLDAHRVLEHDEVSAAVIRSEPEAVGHAHVPQRERRGLREAGATQRVDDQPAQQLVIAEPAPAGMAAGHRGGDALDPGDPHDLLDQVDLAGGVGGAPGGDDPPTAVRLVSEPRERPLDLPVCVLDADQRLEPLLAQRHHRPLRAARRARRSCPARAWRR